MTHYRHLVLVGFGPVHALALRRGAFDGWRVSVVLDEPAIAAPLVTRGLLQAGITALPARKLVRQAGLSLIEGTPSALDPQTGQLSFSDHPPLAFDAISVERPAVPDLAIVYGDRLVGPFRADSPAADVALAPFFSARKPLVVGSVVAAGFFALNGPSPTGLVIPGEMAEVSPLHSPIWRDWLGKAGVACHVAPVADLTAEGVLTADGRLIGADVTLVVTEAPKADWMAQAPLVHALDPFADCSGLAVRAAAQRLAAHLAGRASPEKQTVYQPLQSDMAARSLFGRLWANRLFRRLADRHADALMAEIGAPGPALLPTPASAVPESAVSGQAGEWPAGVTLWQGDGASAMQAHVMRSFDSNGLDPAFFGQLAAQAALAPLQLMGCRPELVSVALGNGLDAAAERGLKQCLADMGVATAFSRMDGDRMALAALGRFEPERALGHIGARAGDAVLLVRSPVSGLHWQADRLGQLGQNAYRRAVLEAKRPFAPLVEMLLANGATAAALVERDGLYVALQRLVTASRVLCAVDCAMLTLPPELVPLLPGTAPDIEGLVGGHRPTPAEAFVLTGGAFPPALLATVPAERLAESCEALRMAGESFVMLGHCMPRLPGLTGGITMKESSG